jgi:hypothetical protein
LTTVNLKLGKTVLSAFATCSDGFFNVDMKDARLDAIDISDVYLTDGRRYFQQDSIAAMTMVPYVETSRLSETLVVVSGNSCFVTAVSERRGIVPNNTKVKGSPHTLIELRSLNWFVSASSYVSRRSSTTRTVRDLVQFSSGDRNYCWQTDIGWKVHSMTEWSFRRTPAAAKHIWIAVAVGRITRFDDVVPPKSTNGKVVLLRPPTTGGGNDFEAKTWEKFDAPVTAIATYGDSDLVLCSGTKVHFFRWNVSATTTKSVFSMNIPSYNGIS